MPDTAQPATARTFLLLQGPASPFLKYLAQAIENKGHHVLKLNFCLGDMVFWWPRESHLFRGKAEDWAVYLDRYISHHNITDIVMLGDGRPVHAVAAEIGLRRDLRVHILEHGYLRPDWLTIEPDGMSAQSRFPKDRASIERLAHGGPPSLHDRRYASSFLTYALYDLAYHVPNVLLGWLVHPHYRTHGPVHPIVEYAGWIGKAMTGGRRKRQAEAAICRWLAEPGGRTDPPRFLFPLQLPGDYQIIRHAPGGDLFRIVDAVIASFARHAPMDARLLFKVHPIDNGLSRWPERISAAARRHGIEDRVFYAAGGDTDRLIAQASGVVTVNSTVGLTALGFGKPVIALGAAIYDMQDLTDQGRLADFWQMPEPPDPGFYQAFQRALAATIQVRGGFIGHQAITDGAANVAALISEPDARLPLHLRKPRDAKTFPHAEELGLG